MSDNGERCGGRRTAALIWGTNYVAETKGGERRSMDSTKGHTRVPESGNDAGKAAGVAGKPKRLIVGNDVDELELDLSRSRVIPIIGRQHDGTSLRWDLKVTRKERVTLV